MVQFSLLFLTGYLCLVWTALSAGNMKNSNMEIGHYDIKIKSAEKEGEELKTYYLYKNKNPSLQAKTFCEENGIHPDGNRELLANKPHYSLILRSALHPFATLSNLDVI